jgi:hypothetical protein
MDTSMSSSQPPTPALRYQPAEVPNSISAEYTQELKKDVRALAVDFDSFYPELVLSYASGRRPEVDAEGAGPGFVQAVHFIKVLMQNGHMCFSGLHVPPSKDWRSFFLRLNGMKAKAKMMIALLSPAYFQSLECLEELYKAIEAGVNILLVRKKINGME